MPTLESLHKTVDSARNRQKNSFIQQLSDGNEQMAGIISLDARKNRLKEQRKLSESYELEPSPRKHNLTYKEIEP